MTRPDYREPEAVPADWLKEESERRKEAFAALRAIQAHERRARREAMDHADRLKLIAAQIAQTMVNSAGSIARSARSADTDGLPKRASQYELASLPEAEVAKLVDLAGSDSPGTARRAIERLEQAYDAHVGVAQLPDVSKMISVEKDRRIIELRADGLSAREINTLEPWLGDVLCIRRVLAADDD